MSRFTKTLVAGRTFTVKFDIRNLLLLGISFANTKQFMFSLLGFTLFVNRMKTAKIVKLK